MKDLFYILNLFQVFFVVLRLLKKQNGFFFI